MARFIAFLRAINVGGHTVKMDHLRGLFESLDLANVETFIASGNVIFESNTKNPASLERKIAAHLEKSLGYAVDTFLRMPQEIAGIEKHSPFKVQTKAETVYVAFLHEKPALQPAQALISLRNDTDDLAIRGREVYWLRREREASLFTNLLLEKTLGLAATSRNMTTVSKLVEKYP